MHRRLYYSFVVGAKQVHSIRLIVHMKLF